MHSIQTAGGLHILLHCFHPEIQCSCNSMPSTPAQTHSCISGNQKKDVAMYRQSGASVIPSNTVIKQQSTQNAICKRFLPDRNEQIIVWRMGWRHNERGQKRWLHQNFSTVGSARANQSRGVKNVWNFISMLLCTFTA